MDEITGNFGNFFQDSAAGVAVDIDARMKENQNVLRKFREEYLLLMKGIYD